MCVKSAGSRRSSYRRIKRFADVVFGGVAMVVSLPAQLVVAAAVRSKLGAPVFFRQTRPGLDAEPFELVKFRSMLTPEQASGVHGDKERMTPFGAWLRATSLDELPSLWNVVRGDLSLVGPRPLLMDYLGHYSPRQARRHEVRPGMTGLAQVSGRNAISWEERLELDAEYVERMSLQVDLGIILRTVRTVVDRRGVSAPGEATVQPFVPLSPAQGAS